MAGPNEKEKALLLGFRSQVEDLNLEDDSDMFLLRWIRAREYNLKQAEAMLRQHRQWWKDNDVDNILSWKVPVEVPAVNPVDILGYDHDNHPVAVIPFGRWDVKQCIQSNQRADFIRYVDQLYIKVLDMMKGKTLKSTGLPVTQFVVIYDCDGLSARLLTSYGAIDAMMETLRRFESNHPETLKNCYIVNASRVFELLFKIVKPILSQRTFGKVQVFTNESKWKPILTEAIPLSILPASLGGNNNDSIINTFKRGGKKNNKCASNGNGHPDTESLCSVEDEENGYTVVTVGAGEKFPVEIEVQQPNTTIDYSFKSIDYDIGFSLLRGDSDSEEVVKYSRVNSHQVKEGGSVVCEKTGTYRLLFDNSYSRYRAKTVLYKVELQTENGSNSNSSPTPSANGLHEDSQSL